MEKEIKKEINDDFEIIIDDTNNTKEDREANRMNITIILKR